jgi:SAM-dependent methyltransferase
MEWFRQWFGPLYDEIYVHRDPAEARVQVDALLGRIGILALPVLDAGCGAGRHLGVLRECGCRAVGLDLSAHLLGQAILSGPVVRADLRAPPFRAESFGMVAAFFTVFGYLERREDDLALLSALTDLVAPGGYLYLDLPDPLQVRTSLVPRDEKTLSGIQVVQERWIEDGQVFKSIQVRRDGADAELYLERVRLWECEDIGAEAERRGLETVARFGHADGREWTPGSPRMACLWRKIG